MPFSRSDVTFTYIHRDVVNVQERLVVKCLEVVCIHIGKVQRRKLCQRKLCQIYLPYEVLKASGLLTLSSIISRIVLSDCRYSQSATESNCRRQVYVLSYNLSVAEIQESELTHTCRYAS